jgi:hypothetical protein
VARVSGAGLAGWYCLGLFAKPSACAMPVAPPTGVVTCAVSIRDLPW